MAAVIWQVRLVDEDIKRTSTHDDQTAWMISFRHIGDRDKSGSEGMGLILQASVMTLPPRHHVSSQEDYLFMISTHSCRLIKLCDPVTHMLLWNHIMFPVYHCRPGTDILQQYLETIV